MVIDKEEEELKKKLEKLERKYNETLFEEPKVPDLEKVEEPEIPEIPVPEEIEEPEGSEIPVSEEIKKPEGPEIPVPEEPGEVEELEEIKEVKKKIFKKPKKSSKILKPSKLIKKLVKPKKKERTEEKIKEKVENNLSGKISSLEIKKSTEKIQNIKKEMGKILIGQEETVNGLIMGLLCNANVLVEGVPGIAKTLAIRALASASGCSVKRIQFTVDMLPTDITGITNYTPEKGFEVIKGPIFANFLIADEINRAPPKTQSALIEGMQERQVTIGRKKFQLPEPFFVMATENPIENAGVYPLPEAQVDRFLFKLIVGYPKADVEKKVMDTNITLEKFEKYGLKAVTNPKELIELQTLVKKVYLDDDVKNYILKIVRKTREKDFENAKYISYGCSPRASIGLFIASKANALMEGRDYVLPEDVRKVAFSVMRHRLLLSYKASIQKISSDLIIKEILNSISVD